MPKLAALTTCRFFAAMAIVIFHFQGPFEITRLKNQHLSFAVSFFFILSGFILAYKYPKLESWQEKKSFFVARIARIWPAHLFFLALIILLGFFEILDHSDHAPEFFLNASLTQAWIPYSKSYFSYNAPSWSISTEFFFYLCFPYLISNWSETWYWKAFLITSLTLCCIWYCAYQNVPHFSNERIVTTNGLLNVHPLSRLIEFFIGIGVAKIWLTYKDKIAFNIAIGTFAELAVLTLVALNFVYYDSILLYFSTFVPENIQYAFNFWAYNGFFQFLSFSLLIMILALDKGFVSQLFSHPWGIFLGEISFSIYLFHHILFRVYISQFNLLQEVPKSILLGSYIAILLMVSTLVWKFIENPLRKKIIQKLQSKEIPIRSPENSVLGQL